MARGKNTNNTHFNTKMERNENKAAISCNLSIRESQFKGWWGESKDGGHDYAIKALPFAYGHDINLYI